MTYKILALSDILETTLFADGPGASVFIISIVFPLDFGTTAIINRSIPMPPIQCVKLRQNKMDLGSEWIYVRMVEPVVVKPETLSKNASI